MNLAPAPSVAVSTSSPGHPLGQLAADRQPQAEPGLPPFSRPRLKALEDQLALLIGYTGAVVADAQLRAMMRAEDHLDLGAARADADRVVEQDPQDSRDAAGIAESPNRTRLVPAGRS